ncbi:DUF3261 domain-containing protein [Parvibium lacunae]|uniref:Uncharacterized protein n=1 Tax=Parvibium lacunae TaxID=1888893 RepID=A0A368L1R7_9BURK|nr:DUF3261 domain-containing protein [Parvibium lacunae]RCS57497.1 hypothetical protein DU000_08595 [Parvibium lacunae]
MSLLTLVGCQVSQRHIYLLPEIRWQLLPPAAMPTAWSNGAEYAVQLYTPKTRLETPVHGFLQIERNGAVLSVAWVSALGQRLAQFIDNGQQVTNPVPPTVDINTTWLLAVMQLIWADEVMLDNALPNQQFRLRLMPQPDCSQPSRALMNHETGIPIALVDYCTGPAANQIQLKLPTIQVTLIFISI